MSKVGKSIIQGAIEALEFARGKDKGSTIHIPEVTKKPDTSRVDSKTIECGSGEVSFSASNCHRKS